MAPKTSVKRSAAASTAAGTPPGDDCVLPFGEQTPGAEDMATDITTPPQKTRKTELSPEAKSPGQPVRVRNACWGTLSSSLLIFPMHFFYPVIGRIPANAQAIRTGISFTR